MTEQAPLCIPLSHCRDITVSGGKGAQLGGLIRAGVPVPDGFCITTAAYDAYLAHPGTDDAMAEIFWEIDQADDVWIEQGRDKIRELFTRDRIPSEVLNAILDAYAQIGDDTVVAVRSSSTAEDLVDASYAGQMESFLNVRGSADLCDAVIACWASLWTPRAIEYRLRHELAINDVSSAIVVQKLVDADASGVLFTADPVAKDTSRTVIHAAWGLGESIVGGEVSTDSFTIDNADGTVLAHAVADKAVMTMRAAHRTEQQPVPDARRRQPAINEETARDLHEFGRRIAAEYGRPVDIEWAVSGASISILQARPITGMFRNQPRRQVWNDSMQYDALWTSSNLGEAIPSVMTPSTWSILQDTLEVALGIPEVGGMRFVGNLGGRPYLNLTLLYGAASAAGIGKIMENSAPLAFGVIPDGLQIPSIPTSRWRLLIEAIPKALAARKETRVYRKNLSTHLREFPPRCSVAMDAIYESRTIAQLQETWEETVAPLLHDSPRILGAGASVNSMALARLHPWLRKYVSDASANALITGAHSQQEGLASLEQLTRIHELAKKDEPGDFAHDDIARRFGHRGPDELELSAPRPGEDPQWVDRQLARSLDAPDIESLFQRRDEVRDKALQEFQNTHPGKVAELHARLRKVAEALRAREATRSESVRCMWVIRQWFLRAGLLLGIDDDVFFLSVDELHGVLSGDTEVLDDIPSRRATYLHYQGLGPYPLFIRGAFAPEAWAADPDRRTDVYDASGTDTIASRSGLSGSPGSSGVAHGTARVLDDLEDGHRLNVGDVLVTNVTNVGWTPLFPKAAAIVTDVGSPLSHAAIVARELAIPAVVGCANATRSIHDGDIVAVDGDVGTVEIVKLAARSHT